MSSKKSIKRSIRIKIRKYLFYILFFLTLFLLAAYFSYRELSMESFKPEKGLEPVPEHTESLKFKKEAKREVPSVKPEKKLKVPPRIAIVIDDLGPNKKTAMKVFNIKAPLTLSILPQETFTAWIADEGHRLGYDIIGHIPMEAKDPQRLGKGGLYTWMTDNEIRRALNEDIESIPHIKGVSNHMGSAFTEDERTMNVLLSVLQENGLFALDSLTTSKSVGEKLAVEKGLRIFKRDIFLDYDGSLSSMEDKWGSLVKIARKRGYAVALAHPREKTIEFLKKIISEKDVEIVPISRVINDQYTN